MEEGYIRTEPESVEELRDLIAKALIASDGAGAGLVSCYLQMALDMLTAPKADDTPTHCAH